MPADDARNAALLAEGMTQGEIDYMNSGGTKTDGLSPPSDDGAPAPAEPATPEPAVGAQPAAQPAAEPQPEPDGPEAPPKDSPYYAQWKREKNQRQELQRTLQVRDEAIISERRAREDAIAAERASTQQERERWARLDERLRVFQQAVEQPAQAPPGPPDPETDPFAYMRWLGEQVTGLKDTTGQVATHVQERDAAAELQTTYIRDAREFATRQTDFGSAYNWLMANRDAELAAAGYLDPGERTRIISLDERDIVARALVARQMNPNAPGPAQIIYGLAKARGFALPAAPAPRTGNTGAGAPTNGAGAPAAPSVTQQVEAIQRGQAASRSLSSGGGAPVPTGIDLARLADMSDGEYLAWKNTLTPAERQELAGMLGAPAGNEFSRRRGKRTRTASSRGAEQSMPRLGRRERARLKKHRRSSLWRSAWGAGTVFAKLGRKKLAESFKHLIVK